jgi:hypothetical protein
MKTFLTIAFTLASFASFADDLKCIRETQNQIEAVKAVSNYKFKLIRSLQSSDAAEVAKAETAFEKLQENITNITFEACESADN